MPPMTAISLGKSKNFTYMYHGTQYIIFPASKYAVTMDFQSLLF